MSASVVSVISRFLEEYLSSTPQRLKLLDAYLLYILLTGALQFGYCLLVGTFPFNSFLSGFISCVGSFILAGTSLSEDMMLDTSCSPISFRSLPQDTDQPTEQSGFPRHLPRTSFC
uniref:Dolichyl-diphosphooligosaccharide--protein glycosyltransferase subunit DAD1 n=1 Tax=Felis catus TaxID=9685 RepID=A0ABI7YVK4_FELCA